MQRSQHDGGTKPDTRRPRTRGGQERQGRRDVVVGKHMVLREPDRVGAEVLGLLDRLESEGMQSRGILAPRMRITQVEIQSDFHPIPRNPLTCPTRNVPIASYWEAAEQVFKD